MIQIFNDIELGEPDVGFLTVRTVFLKAKEYSKPLGMMPSPEGISSMGCADVPVTTCSFPVFSC
jgi:hypothetical protein